MASTMSNLYGHSPACENQSQTLLKYMKPEDCGLCKAYNLGRHHAAMAVLELKVKTVTGKDYIEHTKAGEAALGGPLR
jgi:hypothetical protein